MILPPIFTICKASTAVTALLGSNPVRFYPFGTAPQDVGTPYAVWQGINGQPINSLSDRPDIEDHSLQIDVYGITAEETLAVAAAIEYAIETESHITRYSDQGQDQETLKFRISFDVDWFVNR